MALVRRALQLSFLLVKINGLVTPLSDTKRADLALPDSCLIETNKNAAHGKISYSREWPTTATAKECAKVASMWRLGLLINLGSNRMD